MTLEPGTSIREYEILAKLRTGGMGNVYRVKNKRVGRTEAMKVLRDDVSDDAESRQRFDREIRALASLNHANVATVRTAFVENNCHYLIMEFVDGVDLDVLISQGRIPVATVLQYTMQILSALEHARLCGIVHRDIKPSNIRITPDGAVKLLDFGLAQNEGATRLTQSNTVLGTPLYLSPEQWYGQPGDHRSDLYSVGLVLYELVTGYPLVPKDLNTVQMKIEHLRGKPASPKDFVPEISADLNRVILKAIQKNPAERYARAGDFLSDLQHCTGPADPAGPAALPDEAATRRTASPPPRPSRSYRSRAFLWPALRWTLVPAVIAGVVLAVKLWTPLSWWTNLGVNTWRLSIRWDRPVKNDIDLLGVLSGGRVVIADGPDLLWVDPDGHARCQFNFENTFTMKGISALTVGPAIEYRVPAKARTLSFGKGTRPIRDAVSHDGVLVAGEVFQPAGRYWKRLLFFLEEKDYNVTPRERAIIPLNAGTVQGLSVSRSGDIIGYTDSNMFKIDPSRGDPEWVVPHYASMRTSDSNGLIAARWTAAGYRTLKRNGNAMQLGWPGTNGWIWVNAGRFSTDKLLLGTVTEDGGALLYGADDLNAPFLLKIDSSGTKEWDRDLPYPKQIRAILESGSVRGGFGKWVLLAGDDTKSRLVYLDATGNLVGEWANDHFSEIRFLTPVGLDGFIVAAKGHVGLLEEIR